MSIRLALRAAIDAYTSTAAFVSFDEAEKGTLAPGQLAAFVVLATGVFTTAPRTAADLAATTTVFGGKVVYERPGVLRRVDPRSGASARYQPAACPSFR